MTSINLYVCTIAVSGDNYACEETIIDVPEFAFDVLQLFVNAPLRESQSEDCVNSMKI